MSAPVQAERLVLTALPDMPLVRAGDDLPALILAGVGRAGLRLEEGDVIAIASKIVAKAEGRTVELKGVTPSDRALRIATETGKDARIIEVILRESREILRIRQDLIIVEHRLGFVCANAGVDHSNVHEGQGSQGEWVLMLPEDPSRSAHALRDRLQAESGVTLGVLVVDSHGRAWRMGTVGMAIGVAGLPAVLDLRGRPDLFGDKLQVTQVGLADELAAAASILMGQAAEGRPVIHLRGVPYPLREGSLQELLRPMELDLFR